MQPVLRSFIPTAANTFCRIPARSLHSSVQTLAKKHLDDKNWKERIEKLEEQKYMDMPNGAFFEVYINRIFKDSYQQRIIEKVMNKRDDIAVHSKSVFIFSGGRVDSRT